MYLANLTKSPEDSRDWKAEEIFIAGQKLPGTLDLRDQLTPIRNQGSQGSCVAMSAARMKEWQEFKDMGIQGYFSPQFIYNLRQNPEAEGMYMRDLMRILKAYGDCTEEDYPYGSTEDISHEVMERANIFRIKGYAAINDIDTLKTALNTNGVCLLAVPVYNFGSQMWHQRPGEEFLGGHAMAIVGYNYDGFLIANSWGDKWGDKGYTLFPYEHWGDQWEVWTTVDEKSKKEVPKRSWIVRFFDFLASLFLRWPKL